MGLLRLSICIPTHNRFDYLQETIISIINQINKEDANKVEICISDNASTDGTEFLVKEIIKISPIRIVFNRNEYNLGADKNFLKAVELATGEYCWLMGSDDLAALGSLERLLHEIEEGHDIYLCNRIDCNIMMKPIRNRYWLDMNISSEIFNLTNPTDFKNYVENSKSIGALFSYLSSIVFRKEKWQAVNFDPVFLGTAYSHVYMLLSFIKTGCSLKYISDHLVLCRGDNDSFMDVGYEGVIKRIMLDIDGYLLLAEKIFPNDPIYFNGVLSVLRAELPAIKTLSALRLRTDEEKWISIASKFKEAGYNPVIIFIVGLSRSLINLMLRIRDSVTRR